MILVMVNTCLYIFFKTYTMYNTKHELSCKLQDLSDHGVLK